MARQQAMLDSLRQQLQRKTAVCRTSQLKAQKLREQLAAADIIARAHIQQRDKLTLRVCLTCLIFCLHHCRLCHTLSRRTNSHYGSVLLVLSSVSITAGCVTHSAEGQTLTTGLSYLSYLLSPSLQAVSHTQQKDKLSLRVCLTCLIFCLHHCRLCHTLSRRTNSHYMSVLLVLSSSVSITADCVTHSAEGQTHTRCLSYLSCHLLSPSLQTVSHTQQKDKLTLHVCLTCLVIFCLHHCRLCHTLSRRTNSHYGSVLLVLSSSVSITAGCVTHSAEGQTHTTGLSYLSCHLLSPSLQTVSHTQQRDKLTLWVCLTCLVIFCLHHCRLCHTLSRRTNSHYGSVLLVLSSSVSITADCVTHSAEGQTHTTGLSYLSCHLLSPSLQAVSHTQQKDKLTLRVCLTCLVTFCLHHCRLCHTLSRGTNSHYGSVLLVLSSSVSITAASVSITADCVTHSAEGQTHTTGLSYLSCHLLSPSLQAVSHTQQKDKLTLRVCLTCLVTFCLHHCRLCHTLSRRTNSHYGSVLLVLSSSVSITADCVTHSAEGQTLTTGLSYLSCHLLSPSLQTVSHTQQKDKLTLRVCLTCLVTFCLHHCRLCHTLSRRTNSHYGSVLLVLSSSVSITAGCVTHSAEGQTHTTGLSYLSCHLLSPSLQTVSHQLVPN